jgi:hypothetical protein
VKSKFERTFPYIKDATAATLSTLLDLHGRQGRHCKRSSVCQIDKTGATKYLLALEREGYG